MLLSQKYIKHRVLSDREEYLVCPPGWGTYRVVRDLDDAIDIRNKLMGYDPDIPMEEKMTQRNAQAVTIFADDRVRFGAIGDTHLGSRYERLDVLNALYDFFEQQGIEKVLHTGNWIEGEAPFNKEDINISGIENQFDYFFKNYPRRVGITTYFVGGDDHEGWYHKRQGISLRTYWDAKAREWYRDDMVYLGYMEADVVLPFRNEKVEPVTVRVIHPGGGSAKSISLQAQNIVDGWHPDEFVDILLVGHYHKSHMLPDYKGVTVIQTGTCQDKTPFIRKNKLAVHIGGWVVEAIRTSEGGLVVNGTYVPFKANNWKYKEKVDPRFLGG